MEYSSTLTTCPYCGCGCNFYLQVLDGNLIGASPSETSPVNQGKLCVKGWNAWEFVQNPKRLTKPLVRKNGKLVESTWDEALNFVAGKMKKIKSAHGAEAFGFFASAKVTNEDNYLIQKFARAAIGTNSVDHCARL